MRPAATAAPNLALHADVREPRAASASPDRFTLRRTPGELFVDGRSTFSERVVTVRISLRAAVRRGTSGLAQGGRGLLGCTTPTLRSRSCRYRTGHRRRKIRGDILPVDDVFHGREVRCRRSIPPARSAPGELASRSSTPRFIAALPRQNPGVTAIVMRSVRVRNRATDSSACSRTDTVRRVPIGLDQCGSAAPAALKTPCAECRS